MGNGQNAVVELELVKRNNMHYVACMINNSVICVLQMDFGLSESFPRPYFRMIPGYKWTYEHRAKLIK